MNRRGFFSSITGGTLAAGVALARSGTAPPAATGKYDVTISTGPKGFESGVAIARANREEHWLPSIETALDYVLNETLALTPGPFHYRDDFRRYGAAAGAVVAQGQAEISLCCQVNRGVTPSWIEPQPNRDIQLHVFFFPAARELAEALYFGGNDIVTVDLAEPWVHQSARFVRRGLAMRGIKAYDFEADRVNYRFDVLCGARDVDGQNLQGYGAHIQYSTPDWSALDEGKAVQTAARS